MIDVHDHTGSFLLAWFVFFYLPCYRVSDPIQQRNQRKEKNTSCKRFMIISKNREEEQK